MREVLHGIHSRNNLMLSLSKHEAPAAGKTGSLQLIHFIRSHLKGRIVTLPIAVRARVAGSYMSSMWAAGWR
jgi:hypothetical protein